MLVYLVTVVAHLTVHKSIGSLLRDTTASKNQQKEMCDILQGKRTSTPNVSEMVPIPHKMKKKKDFSHQAHALNALPVPLPRLPSPPVISRVPIQPKRVKSADKCIKSNSLPTKS